MAPNNLPAVLLATCAVLLALAAPLVVVAGDPDMLQDICVADYKSLNGPLRVNGFPCKREANVTADDFFFGGLAKAADVYSGNPMGSAVTAADVEALPGLNTLGVSMARTDYAPWGGVNPPHAHPRATEILFVVEGTLEVGFVTASRLLSRTVSRGEVFVFPRGLVHFQRSVGPAPAVAVSALDSQLPGTQAAAAALFGAAPAVPTDVLARAFRTDAGTVETIKSKFVAPKSMTFGVFICIKCSGAHRSLGVHISKVVSVKLDEWTDEQVDLLADSGGNAAVNMRYEAFMPENYTKPRQDCSSEERSDFIRRKYEVQQFLSNPQLSSCPPRRNDKQSQQHHSGSSRHGLGHSFKNSWRRKAEHEPKAVKKTMELGMVEFIGLMKVDVIKGTNLAIRDVMSSDPYVVINLGHQSMKTKVIKSSLNPVWNERLLLSIPDPIPLLKLQVLDKDTFTTDDRMGEAEINIEPLVAAARAYEASTIADTAQLNKWMAKDGIWIPRDSAISIVNGKVKQVVTIRLQNVERGHLEMELECVPLTQ